MMGQAIRRGAIDVRKVMAKRAEVEECKKFFKVFLDEKFGDPLPAEIFKEKGGASYVDALWEPFFAGFKVK